MPTKLFMNEPDEIDFDSPEFIQAVTEAKTKPEAEIPETVVVSTEPAATAAATPETPEAPAAAPATPAEPNYAEYLATKSGGLFKNEEDFIAALEKVKNYDSVETRLKDTEAQLPKFKNDETKQWFDLVQSDEGKKALKEYLAETEKDYATMSDVDVRREALQKEHPQWSKKDVELELRHKYGKDLELKDLTAIDKEEDPDAYLDAVNHNKEVERNLELLAVHARDDRYSLIEKQKLISLPEIKKTETPAAAPQISDEEKAEAVAKWQKRVEETVPNLSNFKMDIDDKGVEYVWTDEEKAAQVAEMKDFNIFKWMQSEGWTNPDNSWNPDKIAEGVRLMRDHKKIIASVASQVKTEAIRATMAKIKGIDPNFQSSDNAPQTYATLEEAAHAKLKEVRAKRGGVEYEEQD